MTPALQKNMWSACTLAFSINQDGHLPEDYKKRNDYKEARFIGDIETYVGAFSLNDNTSNKYQTYLKSFLGEELHSNIAEKKTDNTNIHAALIGLNEDSDIIISFRGTNGPLDWVNDLMAEQVDFYSFGKVHKGFSNGIKTIKDQLLCKVDELIKISGKQKTRLYITGHSKGAALATLMAKLSETISDNIVVTTFGSPRVGDNFFRENYKIKHFSFDSVLDLIPHLPFSAQENVIIPRMSPLYKIEGVYPFDDYSPLGIKMFIYKPKNGYGMVPYDTSNEKSETLNSLYAIEPIVRKLDVKTLIGLITDTHINDYKVNPLNNEYWMSELSDKINITDLSIPGTHDTMAYQGCWGAGMVEMLSKTQKETLTWQLTNGVRYFDLRVADDMSMHHGIINLKTNFSDDVLEVIDHFLRKNPTEAIFVRIKNENGKNNDLFDKNISVIYAKYQYIMFKSDDVDKTTLAEIRGKIVIFDDTSSQFFYKKNSSISLWNDNSKMKIQDNYKNPSFDEKYNNIINLLEESNNSVSNIFYINHVSATGNGLRPLIKNPQKYAETLNPMINEYIKDNAIQRTGILIYDFINDECINSVLNSMRYHRI